MSKLKERIKKYQLTTFFIFTYLFTWLFILPVLLTGDQQLFGIFALVGLFCPALVNIIISRIIDRTPSEETGKGKRFTFLVAWIISTVVFTLNVTTTSEIESPFAIIIFSIIAILPALVFASAFSKFKAVSQSLISLVKPKGHYGYYLFALLMAPTIKLISVPVSNLLGFGVISEPDQSGGILQLIGIIVISFSYGFLFAGGVNEEVGWTGFALPRLQSLYSPFTASIILWFFWILWHIPMQMGGYWNPELDAFIRALIGTFFARFILTWLFNKTRGGILPAMILHVSANVSFAVLPVTYVAMIFEALLAIYFIFKSRMWKKLPDDSPAVFRMIVETT
jgi:membrane protease YdiL (CAAX protease family)